MTQEVLVNEPIEMLYRVMPNGDAWPTSFIWRDRTRYVAEIGRHWEERIDGRTAANLSHPVRRQQHIRGALGSGGESLDPASGLAATTDSLARHVKCDDDRENSSAYGHDRQMQEVDRLMIEEYQIDLIQMMENAGRSLAMLARFLLDGDIVDRPIVVLAGRGNNGGGGLVAARHLLNWGAWVQVVCSYSPEDYSGVPAHQLAALQAMGAPVGLGRRRLGTPARRPPDRRHHRLWIAGQIRVDGPEN